MQRIWDIFIGIIMILAALVCQAIVIFIVIGLLSAGVASYFNIQNEWFIWIAEIVAAIVLNVIAFLEFRRQTRAHRMLGVGGGFFLLYRGIYRIAFVREMYLRPSADHVSEPGR